MLQFMLFKCPYLINTQYVHCTTYVCVEITYTYIKGIFTAMFYLIEIQIAVRNRKCSFFINNYNLCIQ